MITGKINLAALKHVAMEKKGKSGMVKGMFIPIEANNLFKSEKSGAVYLDIVAWDLKEPQEHSTHLVKQSLPKDVREKMSKEEISKMPIIGNLNISTGYAEANNDAGNGQTFDENDDLPF